MPKTFNNINLCVVGKLEDADKIPGWLRYHGGETSKKIDSRVTHLVASEEAFRGDAEPGKYKQHSFLKFLLPNTDCCLSTIYSSQCEGVRHPYRAL